MRLERHSLVAWCVALVDKNVIPINSGKLKSNCRYCDFSVGQSLTDCMLAVVPGVVPRVGGDVSLPWFQVLGIQITCWISFIFR